MQGWLIFKHAVVMLWGNRWVALQLALAPFLIATLLVTAYVMVFSDFGLMQETLFPGTPIGEQPEVMPEDLGSFFTGLVGFLVLTLVFTLWVIVAWHRFILLEEAPKGLLPAFNGNRILAYFGQILKLVLLGALSSIPFTILMVFAAGSVSVMVALGTIYGVALTVVFYRLSIILPASAIGRPISIGEGWRATEGTLFTIIVLVIVADIAQMIVQFVVGLLMVFPVLGFAINLLTSFAIGMLNASILTTLYGHYIEGRAL